MARLSVRRNRIDIDERLVGLLSILLGAIALFAPGLLNYIVAIALIIYGASKFL